MSKKKKELFTNPKFLYENSFSELTEIEDKGANFIKERVLDDIKEKRTEVIAFLGANGSGKSTVLRSVFGEMSKSKKIVYIPFEIWQESDEDQIWENLIINIIAEDRNKRKTKVARMIDGIAKKWWYIPLALYIAIIATWMSACWTIKINDNQYVSIGRIVVESFGMVGIISVLLNLASISPMKRVFEYEEKLLEILCDEDGKPLVVLMEDVDRTEAGKKVLESLHTFINNNRDKIRRPFIIVCPIPRDSFYGNADNMRDNLKTTELSCKVYDQAIWSGLRKKITESDIETILSSAGCTNGELVLVIRKLLPIVDMDASVFNLRVLKFILREIDQFIRYYPALDPCVAVLFIITKYVRLKKSTALESPDDLKIVLKDGFRCVQPARRTQITDLFGLTFGITDKIEWRELGNGAKIPTNIVLEYQRNDEKHVIDMIDDGVNKQIRIRLSGHYKELL